MADQTFKPTNKPGDVPSSHSFPKAAPESKPLADQALSAGRDIKDKAKGAVEASSETLKDQASDFVDAAKDVASQATDKFKQAVEAQKSAGSDYVGSLAGTIRRAAKEFDSDLPIAGTYIRKAAVQVESIANTIKTGDINGLLKDARSFARRQPTAFLGLAMLAGFGAVRFLKSSADDADRLATQRVNEARNARSDANRSPEEAGYRDEFSK